MTSSPEALNALLASLLADGSDRIRRLAHKSLMLPPELAERLRLRAEEEGIEEAEAVRRALRAWLGLPGDPPPITPSRSTT